MVRGTDRCCGHDFKSMDSKHLLLRAGDNKSTGLISLNKLRYLEVKGTLIFCSEPFL